VGARELASVDISLRSLGNQAGNTNKAKGLKMSGPRHR
jgi:hypothetical protein